MMNIMNPPADWSTLKKLIWLRGTPINGGEELTVSGTPPLSLPNSLGEPLKAWSVDLSPYQEGSGDPSPDNVRAIHGTDKINIVTSGSRNFLDPSKETTYSGGLGHRWFYADGITLYAGTTYTFSVSGTNQTIALYVEDKATGRDVAYASSGNLTFTLSQTTLVYLQAYRGTAILPENKFQLEVGLTASPYEEFAEPATTSITLPQTVYTGTIGSDGGESRWGDVDLGDVSYAANTFTPTYHSFRITNIRTVPPSSGSDPVHAICSGLKSLYYNAAWTANSIAPNSVNSDLIRVLVPTDINTVAELKALVTGMKLVYELPTPVQFPLTPPTIPTPTGTATTWATAEDGIVDSMSVTYVGKA